MDENTDISESEKKVKEVLPTNFLSEGSNLWGTGNTMVNKNRQHSLF